MRTKDLQVGSYYTNLRTNKCRQIVQIQDGFHIIYKEYYLTINDTNSNYWTRGENAGRTFAQWADRLATQKEITHCQNTKGDITKLNPYQSPKSDTFGTWLMKQTARDDDVGKYARAWQDIVVEARGPTNERPTIYFQEHYIGNNVVKMIREAMSHGLYHLVPGIRMAWHEFIDIVIERDCKNASNI